MLICSVRTQTPDGFAKIIRGFESNAMHYISIYNNLYNQKITLPNIKDLRLTDDELYARALKVFATTESIRDIANKYCDTHGGVNKTEFLFLFEKLTANIYKDFNSNPYICEYYLERPTETINCHVLDFLGEGEKRLEVFKKILDKINEGRGTTDV